MAASWGSLSTQMGHGRCFVAKKVSLIISVGKRGPSLGDALLKPPLSGQPESEFSQMLGPKLIELRRDKTEV